MEFPGKACLLVTLKLQLSPGVSIARVIFVVDFVGLKWLRSDRKPSSPKSECPLPMREKPEACLAEGAGKIDQVCCMLLQHIKRFFF